MNRLLWTIAIVAPCGAFWLAQEAVSDLPLRVDGGGHLLRMRVEGTGSPAVVCEIGLGGALEEWALVQQQVATFTRIVTYDRIGSNHRELERTGRDIARELRRALKTAGVDPPYILVGQSFGGVYNRIFASMYPHDVAGLVLLDPSMEEFIAWMTTHHPDRQISRKDVVGWPEGTGIWSTLEELKTLGPLPDVPTIVVTGARLENDAFRREVLPVWVRSHAEWVRTRPQGRHYLAHHSGHGVHVEAADLVNKIIRELVESSRQCDADVGGSANAGGGDP